MTDGVTPARPRTSTRDAGVVVDRAAVWLAAQVGADGAVTIENVRRPGVAGFSSDTLLFEATWTVLGEQRSGAYVVRLPPPADAFPLFPVYAMDRQVGAMRFVRERSSVPVPFVPWFEPDESVLGAPFYVMEQVDGQVVADVPPYVFESWVTEADEAQRATMRAGAVDLLVGIHGIETDPDELAQWAPDSAGATPLERHVAHQRRYYDWIRGSRSYPLIERAFDRLESSWPQNADDCVLSWGDSRLSNILWRDFEPVAALDWEGVSVGPRELDLGWLVFFHEYFQRIAEQYGYPGVPGLLDRQQVAERYAERSGHEPVDLDWYLLYAELRQALTSIRVNSRAVHFGERPAPEDPNDLILQRDHLEEVLAT